MTTTPTIPAAASPAEATHWLMVEGHLGPPAAAHVYNAHLEGRVCKPEGVEWLRRVAEGETMKSAWARLVLAELADRGLL